MFHFLPLVGTWRSATFHQAPKTWSSSVPFCLPFLSRSGWINCPRKSKKHVLVSSQRFTFSLLLEPPSHHFTLLAPSPSPAQQASPAQTHLLVILNQHDQAALLVSKQNSYFVFYSFVPCLPDTLRAVWGRALLSLPTHRCSALRLCTQGASPPSLPQHLSRQRKYRHSFILSSPLNYNYLKIPRDSRKLGFIWYRQ